jgi:hypothetical protein
MAKNSRDELFDRMRAGGLRKSVAKKVADGIDGARGRSPKAVQSAIDELKSLTAELEDRVTGGPAKRQAAARKGAATRKRQAAQRSAAARKGARTRAQSAASRKGTRTSAR